MHMCLRPGVLSLLGLLLLAVPLLPPFTDDRRWLRDNQQPSRLRQRDLRHPGRSPFPHMLLSCFAHKVALIHREFAQHVSFQTDYRGFPDRSEEPSSSCKRFSSISWERDVFNFNNKHIFRAIKFPWSITDWFGSCLVGSVGRTLRVELLNETVEQFYRLAVVHLYSPIHHSLWSNRDRFAMKSLVVVEETCMISHIRLLQSSISQLSECNKLEKLEVFLEGWLSLI